MGVGTAVGGISAAAGLGSAAIGASASKSAANTQANAADQAAELQFEQSQQALDWEKQMFGIQTELQSPWINAGTNSLNTLMSLLGVPNSTVNPGIASAMGLAGGSGPAQGIGAPLPNSGTGSPVPGPLSPPPNDGSTPGPGNGIFSRGLNRGAALDSGGTLPINGGAPGSVLPNGQGSTNTLAPGGTINNPGAGFPVNLGPPTTPGSGIIPDVGGSGGPEHGGTISMNGGPSNVGVGVNAPGVNPTLGVTNPNSYLQPFQTWNQSFVAPTDVTEQNDPGYKFRLQQGLDAVQNSAAARGTLLTGGTAKDVTDFAQNDASNEYSNVYNRALGEYQQNYNIFQNNQNTEFNRLASIAGLGQTSTNNLTSAGSTNAATGANTLLTSGAQIGQQINNAAAARASGYVGTGNAITGGLNNLSQLAQLYGIFGGGGGGVGAGVGYDPLFGAMGT